MVAPAVRIRGVRKKFVIRHEAARSIQGWVLALLGRASIEHEEFWALDGVDVDIAPGETLGIIGPNGSGKSTMLKLLAGTIAPTDGSIQASGSVFGLLELGAGMHPDLTGRENIFLNGSFLGLNRAEVRALYDQIVAFAELEQFIDTPVKHYSSGMFMRLGFAIAINVDPDILLIDEVLAVGDARFAAKCYEALADVKRRGRTMLLVSHDPIQVRRFADRVLWIDHGRVRMLGRPQEVIQAYLREMRGPMTPALAGDRDADQEDGSGEARIRAAVAVDAVTRREQYVALPGDTLALRLELETDQYLEEVAVGCALRRSDGLLVCESSTAGGVGPIALEPGRTLVECTLGPLPLGAGAYHISVGAWPAHDRMSPYHLWRNAVSLFVGKTAGHQRGTAVVPFQWRVSTSTEHPPLESARDPIAQPDMLSVEAGPLWHAPPSALAVGERDDEWLGAGWYPAENWPPRVRWTAERAVAYLTQDVGQGALILSVCRPLHDTSKASAKVAVDGRHLASFRVNQMDFEEIAVPLDPVFAPTTREVVIDVDGALVPAVVGLDDDTRRLGLAFQSIRVE